MNKLSREDLLLVIFAALESAHAYSAFLPSVFTIRHFGHEDGTKEDIRTGEILATIWALALAIVLSMFLKNSAPLIAWGAVSISMIAVYEYALTTARGPID